MIMVQLILLGSAATVPDKAHDNTYMVLRGDRHSILIDCGGSPLQKLQRVEVDLDALSHLVVTHHHADHIYGVPALLQGLWLYGRRNPLRIHGPQESVKAISSIMDLVGWQDWPNPLPVTFHEVEMAEGCTIIDSPEFEIATSPVEHLIPTLAIKMASKKTGKVIVYSSDTEPCEALVQLANKADILVHECTGDYPGHSTPAQAGAMAKRCGARKLVLIHFPVLGVDLEALRLEAKAEFDGPVELAKDFAVYRF